MNNKEEDITDKIHHPSITKTPLKCKKFSIFAQKTPVLKTYNNSAKRRKFLFTNNTWRKIILMMICLCYNARDNGWVLCASTFHKDNMFIDKDRFLVFEKLYGKKKVKGLYSDFDEVAKLIEDLFSNQKQNVPQDFNILVDLLKNRNHGETPIVPDRAALIKGNFALMSDAVRRNYIISLWEMAKNRGTYSYGVLEGIVKKYNPLGDWDKIVCNNTDDPDLYEVYNTGENHKLYIYDVVDRGVLLVKFIRNALTHLTDYPYNYLYGNAFKTLACCFPEIMLNLQWEFFKEGCLSISDLKAYEQTTDQDI